MHHVIPRHGCYAFVWILATFIVLLRGACRNVLRWWVHIPFGMGVRWLRSWIVWCRFGWFEFGWSIYSNHRYAYRFGILLHAGGYYALTDLAYAAIAAHLRSGDSVCGCVLVALYAITRTVDIFINREVRHHQACRWWRNRSAVFTALVHTLGGWGNGRFRGWPNLLTLHCPGIMRPDAA